MAPFQAAVLHPPQKKKKPTGISSDPSQVLTHQAVALLHPGSGADREHGRPPP